MTQSDNIKKITVNKKAFHDYFIEEELECGIELKGTEVKSLRVNGANLKDSWCSIDDGEIFVKGMHISPYRDADRFFNHDEKRPRKLLLHKREISKFIGATSERGYTLIPIELYFKGSKVKVLLGLCKGKKLYDKRATDAKKSAQRDIERALKER